MPFSERSVPLAAEDLPFAKRAARSSRGAMPSPAEDLDASLRAVPSSEWPVPSLEEIVPSDLLDSPFPERAVRSAKWSVPSKTGTLHTQAADGVVAGEARYAALAERSAQTADRLLRRVSRHRAKGR